MSTSPLPSFLLQWLVPGLTALVCLGGAGVAAFFAQKYPVPALLTLAGMVLLAFVTIAGQASTTIITRRVVDGLTVQEVRAQMMAAVAIFGLLRMVAYALLVTAVFLGRQPAAPPPPPFPGAPPRPPY